MAALSKYRDYSLRDGGLPLCSVLHPGVSCSHNFLILAMAGFRGTAKFVLMLYLIPLMMKRPNNLDNLRECFIDYLKTTICGSLLTSVPVLAICVLRNLLGRFYVISLGVVPGILAGLTIFVQSPYRRKVFTTSLIALVTELYLRILEEKGWINLSLPVQLMFFSAFSSSLLYALRSIPDSHAVLWPLIPQRVPLDNKAQQHCRHKGRCLKSIRDIFAKYFTFGLVLQMVKVTLSHIRLLRYKPKSFFYAFMRPAMLRLPSFLALYYSLFKGVSCLLVNIRGRDEAWHALPAGAVSSLCYIIHPNFLLNMLAFSNLSQIVCVEYTKKKLKLPGLPWNVLLFALMFGLTLHARAIYTDLLPPFMTSMIDGVTDGKSTVVYNLLHQEIAVAK